MAKLYFRYGAMGSSKTANALMVAYNYKEKGQQALLAKPALDNRDGNDVMASRIGLAESCISVEKLMGMSDADIQDFDCIIVDEVQFCTKENIERLCDIVDLLNVPVICYGLRTDFQRKLFEGSMWALAWADVIEEVKTVCWCGKAATCVARFDETGTMVTEGSQVVLGANDKYTSVCRRHHKLRQIHPPTQPE
ncbi:MAG: thymidine kinase [Atopobiaceae bacterium]|nr:thymidine kinase [Atopobiaceae bacterium]